MPQFVYVGAYTAPKGKAEGISVYQFDPASGALIHAQTVPGVDSPSFLAFDPQQRYLFAVGEGDQGLASAFARDPETGRLTFLNRQPTHGSSPCHVSVDPTGRYALVANYGSGNLAVFPIQQDGRLSAASAVVQHEGSSVNPRRQTGPHAHMIAPDPAGRYVLANDLGIDQVLVYRLDGASGQLIAHQRGVAQPGAGPRHFAFHPAGRLVFVINELDSTLTAYAYDPEQGTLEARHTLSTLPSDFHGDNTCAQVVMAPSGRFVYGSNRGHDSIAIFAIDETTGQLTAIGHEPTQGRNPRNFNIDPTGAWLLAANQDSGSIVTFRVDQATGQLHATGQVTETPTPVCILFSQG